MAQADGRPVKRSLTLQGHRTSVSLEEPFWDAFRALAQRRGMTLNALAAQIDSARGTSAGLASAIRVEILADLHDRLAQTEKGQAFPPGPSS